MQHRANPALQKTVIPISVPRQSLCSDLPTPTPRLTRKTLPPEIATTQRTRPTPTPRHRKEIQSKRHLLNLLLGVQEEHCKIQDAILNILQDT